MFKPVPVLLAAALLMTSLALPGQAATYDAEQVYVTSFDGVQIDINVCKPAGASLASPVPLILQSHGWGGTKSSCASGSFAALREAGYGIISITSRGTGNSNGDVAHVHDPEIEGRDFMTVLDYAGTLDWVAKETGPDACGTNDIIVGGMGISYGGAFQLITALEETRLNDCTRFDALAPEITWHDLPDSLAPGGALRTVWVTALFAAGYNALNESVHQAYYYALATGELPQWILDEFAQHSPKWFAQQGIQLDIPVLFRQGQNDNLFILNEAIHNYETILTPGAKDASVIIGYNGGHALPSAAPAGYGGGLANESDPCSADEAGSWQDTAVAWYDFHLRGSGSGVAPGIRLATAQDFSGSRCVTLAGSTLPVTPGVGASLNAGGAPVQIPLTGPYGDGAVMAGTPVLKADWTTLPGGRVFAGISVGYTPADARVVNNNWRPLVAPLPLDLETTEADVDGSLRVLHQIEEELPGLAVDIKPGQSVYLTLAPLVDQFGAHGSRLPGGHAFTSLQVDLPVVEAGGFSVSHLDP